MAAKLASLLLIALSAPVSGFALPAAAAGESVSLAEAQAHDALVVPRGGPPPNIALTATVPRRLWFLPHSLPASAHPPPWKQGDSYQFTVHYSAQKVSGTEDQYSLGGSHDTPKGVAQTVLFGQINVHDAHPTYLEGELNAFFLQELGNNWTVECTFSWGERLDAKNGQLFGVGSQQSSIWFKQNDGAISVEVKDYALTWKNLTAMY